jgi:hypothetical protein
MNKSYRRLFNPEKRAFLEKGFLGVFCMNESYRRL